MYMHVCGNVVQEWSSLRRILRTCENTSRKQESCDLSFLKNIELFLDYVFTLLPDVAHRSEFSSYYSLHLAIVIV